LTLSLMGGFQARAAEDLAIRLPARKSQVLLGYLAVPFGAAHSRERLAALPWSGMPEAQARGNLRQTLSRIIRNV
jgi:DNA-binding SARP family transcriptional activator